MSYSPHYYDLVLVGIAVSIGSGGLIGILTPVALGLAVPIASLIAIVVIGHALFINGPVDSVDDLTAEVEPEELPGVDRAVERFKSE